ncbi:hypothetical protein NIES4071_44050 [Calothrix sp. NIES-4071]|nr:hypothetical protein NIES4071_44050 [Calothrix sp. NIES-4071]BAZ58719.1 hypothetical protein NIES4105_43980 [Calothrix sp. NIES-4105]
MTFYWNGNNTNNFYNYTGTDILQANGYGGRDYIYGGSNNDIIRGGADGDYLYGRSGNDTLYGDEGHDYLVGGIGDDLLYGGIGNDQLYGDNGDDALYGGEGMDNLYGGAGNDKLYGGKGDDYLDGGDGNDFLYGNDHLQYGTGNDELNGGAGNDYIWAGGTSNKLMGGTGNDYLQGSYARDGYNVYNRFEGFGGGANEVDYLVGSATGSDMDVFVLGNENGSFYKDAGYALIYGYSAYSWDQIILSTNTTNIHSEYFISDIHWAGSSSLTDRAIFAYGTNDCVAVLVDDNTFSLNNAFTV